MSAIAKPMIHTAATTPSPSPMVNIEDCINISTFERPAGRPGGTDIEYGIRFTHKNPKTGGNLDTEWIYGAAEATRDAQYTAIIAAVSTAIV